MSQYPAEWIDENSRFTWIINSKEDIPLDDLQQIQDILDRTVSEKPMRFLLRRFVGGKTYGKACDSLDVFKHIVKHAQS